MPLAIELAAARVEALGAVQLLDRLDDRFALLTGGDRLAPGRHRSLGAAVEWSYRLLAEPEQRVFRLVSVFPVPFTLEVKAEAVAGPGAGGSVLRLVECSLAVPPWGWAHGRWRYVMLETLRAYGAGLLAGSGEQDAAAAALAGWAVEVAGQATAGLHTIEGEAAAARWLDAEDATMAQVLAWAMEHDTPAALRLVAALGRWWSVRGRLASQYRLLREVDRTCRAGQRRVVRRAGSGSAARGTGCGVTRPRLLDHAHRAARRGRGREGRPRRWPRPWAAGRRRCAHLGRYAEAAEDARPVARRGPARPAYPARERLRGLGGLGSSAAF